jgi:hypothetical protein
MNWPALHERIIQYRKNNNLSVSKFLFLCDIPITSYHKQLCCESGRNISPSEKPGSIGQQFTLKVNGYFDKYEVTDIIGDITDLLLRKLNSDVTEEEEKSEVPVTESDLSDMDKVDAVDEYFFDNQNELSKLGIRDVHVLGRDIIVEGRNMSDATKVDIIETLKTTVPDWKVCFEEAPQPLAFSSSVGIFSTIDHRIYCGTGNPILLGDGSVVILTAKHCV